MKEKIKNNPKLLAWFILIALAIMWGTSFILIKQGLKVYSAAEVGALRILSASTFLLPFSIPKIFKIKKKNWLHLLSVGLVGSFIPAFLFATAQTQISSYIAGVLNALTPMFVLIIGALVYKQKISARVAIGLAIGFGGTAVLLLAGSSGSLTGANLYGLLIVVAAICYGINVNLIKYRLQGLSSLTITSVSQLMVWPIALIYLFGFSNFTTTFTNTEFALPALGYIILLGVMGTAVALVLFNKLVQITNPVFSSSVTYLVPVVALIWGVWDGEQVLMGHLIGAVTIMVGVYLTNKK